MNADVRQQIKPYLDAFRSLCEDEGLPYCVAVGDGEGEVLEEMSCGRNLPPKVRLPIEAIRAEGSPDALMNTLLSEMPEGAYSGMAQMHARKIRDEAAAMAEDAGDSELADRIQNLPV